MSQYSEKNLEIIKSSQNASIPSLQDFQEEQQKKHNKQMQKSHQKSQNKPTNNHSELQDDYNNINLSSAARKKINMDTQITPGYKKFVIDETNAAYDCIKGMFTREEIEEAFKTLDYRGNNQISSEELTFFLEYIGEKATEEEIEEMIKMCDLDGNGYVSKEEFIKLASGQSLAPIGQSYPPTEELLQKQEIMNNLRLEDFQYQKSKMQNTNQSQKSKKQEHVSKTNESNNFKIVSNKIENDQFQNTKLNNQSQFNQSVNSNFQNKNKSSLFPVVGSQLGEIIQTKKMIENKKKRLLKWQKENVINQTKIKSIIEMLNKVKQLYEDDEEDEEESDQEQEENKRNLAGMYLKNYRDFLTTFSIQDSIDNQEIFNLVKIVEEDNSGQKKEDNMNLQEFVLMLIGAMDIKSIGKYDLAFEAIGKENIYLEDLFYIEKTLTFKSEIAEMKIEEKFKNHRYKKEYLNKSYGTKQMDKELYCDIVRSYPTYFQA